MIDKAKLGVRYNCFQCQTKFYDLNRPEPLCPECQADQREAPQMDMRSLLGKGRRSRKIVAEEVVEAKPAAEDEDDELETADEEEEDDSLGLKTPMK
jgi:uncharacterized protein (TIGR02300 family)